MSAGVSLQLYVWWPHRIPADEARARMTRTLEDLAATYGRAYGRRYRSRVQSAGPTIVGTIQHESPAPTGSADEAWIGGADVGAALGGAVEWEPRQGPQGSVSAQSPDLDALRIVLLESVDPGPQDLALRRAISLPGRWSAASWRDDVCVVVNGLSNGLSMWRVEGPDGWVLGSRAGPLLALSGRAPKMNIEVAALATAFGYVAGSRHLLDDVHRFWPGERAVFRHQRAPIIDRPVGMGDLLGPRRGLSYQDVVREIADRAVALVGGEASRSAELRVGLSGGHDSRLLASAALRAGYRLPASTGGPANSPDVLVARVVAQTLGLHHAVSADAKAGETAEQRERRALTGGGPRSEPMTVDRLAAWIRVNDGTTPTSLAWVANDLSVDRPDPPLVPMQLLSGLGGETHRGSYYPTASDIDEPGTARRGPLHVQGLFGSNPFIRQPIQEILTAEIKVAGDALADLSIPLSEWLSRFHLRFRENCRGSDTLGQADLVNWVWAPLMDAGFLALSREAAATLKVTNQLVEDVTILLAPELSGIAYDRRPLPPRSDRTRAVVTRLGLLGLARRARRLIHRRRVVVAEPGPLAVLWDELFFGPGGHIWPQIVARADLERIVRAKPDSPILKNLAGPELLARAYGLGD